MNKGFCFLHTASLCLFFMLLFALDIYALKRDKRTVVLIHTNMGDIRIALSDLTPIHRDNFVSLVEKGFYDGLLFHRVIKDFVIQTGDPTSRGASADVLLGGGEEDYTLPAEIVFPDLCHLRGAVAAAREGDDVNPEWRSSASQFYIVYGKKMTEAGMKRVIPQLMDRGVDYDRFLYNDYQVQGGTPHLDGAYTVFGEVIVGMDIVREIQSVVTDSADRPLQDVVILWAKVLKRPEARNIKHHGRK